MSSYFEIVHLKKIAKINYILLTVYLSISITSHVIANRLVTIDNIPIISAALTYMSVFVITDVFASYNPRKMVIFIIFLEALANLIFILCTNILVSMPYPSYFHTAAAYKIVFSPIMTLYIANLVGTFISAVIDLFIFYYLYKQRRWTFFFASFFSTATTLTAYTAFTGYFGFRHSYPEHIVTLIHTCIFVNILMVFIYSILGQFLVMGIQKYLNKT